MLKKECANNLNLLYYCYLANCTIANHFLESCTIGSSYVANCTIAYCYLANYTIANSYLKNEDEGVLQLVMDIFSTQIVAAIKKIRTQKEKPDSDKIFKKVVKESPTNIRLEDIQQALQHMVSVYFPDRAIKTRYIAYSHESLLTRACVSALTTILKCLTGRICVCI